MRVVFPLALRYLVARLRQSLLTIAGVALGVVALTVIQAMMGGFKLSFVEKTLGTSPEIMVRRQNFQNTEPSAPTRAGLEHLKHALLVEVPRPPLPDEPERIPNGEVLEAGIKAVAGVAATAPLVTGRIVFSFSGNPEPVVVNGIVPSQHARVIAFAAKLKGGEAADLERDTNGVVVGRFLAERMRVGVGDRVIARGINGRAVGLRIVALHDSYVYEVDNGTVWVNLRRAQSLLGMPGQINAIQVKTVDRDRAEEIARQIQFSTAMDAESWQEAQRNLLGLLNMIVSIMTLVTVFTMTVAGFGIAGNLVTTVSEKTFDIGVLKAMGMRTGHITLVFLVLGTLMVFIGVSVGLGVGYAIVEGLSRVKSAIKPGPGVLVANETMPMVKSWTIYAFAGGFAFVISFLASLSPALRAARLEPLNIIRNAAG